MKKSFLILILMIIFKFNLNAQPDTIIENRFTLKGKLINNIPSIIHCGIIAWAYVFEYEIISYSDTTYKNKNIGVIIPCPEFHGENFFKLGSTYEMVLTDIQTYNYSIINEGIFKKYNFKNKLWVKEIKRN